jgi:hypothetical protein
VKGGHAGGHRDKKWEGVNGQGKQQGKQNAEAEKAEDDANYKHGGNLRDKKNQGMRLLLHHGAKYRIANGAARENLNLASMTR